MKKVMCLAATDFMFPESQILRENERCIWARPSFSKQKIYEGDDLLTVWQIDDVALSGELRVSFKNLF
jgi:hypothetical protein